VAFLPKHSGKCEWSIQTYGAAFFAYTLGLKDLHHDIVQSWLKAVASYYARGKHFQSRINPNMEPAAGVSKTFLFARADFVKSAISMAA
jgi:hypothetical protein